MTADFLWEKGGLFASEAFPEVNSFTNGPEQFLGHQRGRREYAC